MAFHSTISTAASPASVKITHIKQLHMPPISAKKIPAAIKEKVAQSEYLVARAIIDNPGVIVLKESLYEDYTPEVYRMSALNLMSIYHMARHVFPSGFPTTFFSLCQLQKDFLAEIGAPTLLFYLGNITHVYKASSESECKLVDAAFARGEFEVVFEPREKQAIHWAKQAAHQSGNNNVFLVFGAVHNFESRITLLSDPSVIYCGSIDTTKTSTTTTTSAAVEVKEITLSDDIPSELKDAIEYGGLKNYLKKDLINLDQLVKFYNNTPWVLQALRSRNFIEAIEHGIITVDQIGRLSKLQAESLQWKEKGEKLKLKVEQYLNLNAIGKSLPFSMFSPISTISNGVVNSVLHSMLQDYVILK